MRRVALGVIAWLLAVVIPFTGWVSREMAVVIAISCFAVGVLLLAFPLYHRTLPTLRVGPPPLWIAWRQRQRRGPSVAVAATGEVRKPTTRESLGREAHEAADGVHSILYSWPSPGEDNLIVHLYRERQEGHATWVIEEARKLGFTDQKLEELMDGELDRPTLQGIGRRLEVLSQRLLH